MPRRLPGCLVLLLLACAATPSRGGSTRSPVGLEALLLAPAEVAGGWEVVTEAPSDPASDPDLVSWGVNAQLGRHYTRHARGIAQVCSIELWAFADVARATAAHRNFHYPDWEIEREGAILIMLRARTLSLGSRVDRTIFPDCRALRERVRVRAAAVSTP